MNHPNSLFLLLLIVPILICYFYNIKRKRVTVADISIWEEITQAAKNISLLQMKHLFSFLLNCLSILIIVIVITEPNFVNGADQIIILDTSPSTNAGNRIESIKVKAKETLMSIPLNCKVSVITSSGKHHPKTNDKSLLDRFIDNICMSSNYFPLNMIAVYSRTIYPDSVLHFITDGQDKSIEKESNIVTCQAVLENVAITNARIKDNSIWFKVKNYSPQNKELETRPFYTKQTLKPGESKEFVYDKAEKIEIMVNDDFKDDNYILIKNPNIQKLTSVLIHTDTPNQFLKKTLNLISNSSLEVHLTKLADAYKQLKDNCIFIFDHCISDFAILDSKCIYIGVLPFKPPNSITQPKNIQINGNVISESIRLPQINVKKSFVFNNGEPLILSDNGPIAVFEDKNTALIGFNLDDSDFTINPAFPLFFKGLLKLFQSNQNEELVGFLNEDESDISTKFSTNATIKEPSFFEQLDIFTLAITFAILFICIDWLISG